MADNHGNNGYRARIEQLEAELNDRNMCMFYAQVLGSDPRAPGFLKVRDEKHAGSWEKTLEEVCGCGVETFLQKPYASLGETEKLLYSLIAYETTHGVIFTPDIKQKTVELQRTMIEEVRTFRHVIRPPRTKSPKTPR